MNRRRGAGVLLVLAGSIAIVSAWIALQPRTPEQRLAAARELASGIRVTPTVRGTSLLAASAIADFGIGADVRLVRVRVVDALQLSLRIETGSDVTLDAAPRLCLVGPYSAPDDAGLSDRCWGDPDLGVEVAPRLKADGASRPVLVHGQPTELALTVRRGDVRCDYPPGRWRLEVWVAPLVDGLATEDVLATAPEFEVPFASSGPLAPADHSRYCGLANAIYRDQGEPEVVAP